MRYTSRRHRDGDDDGGGALIRFRVVPTLIVLASLAGCDSRIDDAVAASAITQDGFAKDDAQMRALEGRELRLWGFVDHGNLYGDDGARAILGEWWSGAGPTDDTWRFHLKAHADDAVGRSFAVDVGNDAGRDALLRRIVTDARAGRPTRVVLTGTVATFAAPTGLGTCTGVTLKVASSDAIVAAPL